MIEQEKQLLLADLCARLPYKIFAQWHHRALNEFRNVKIMKISTYGKNIDDYYINVLCQPEPGVDYEASIVDIKPYLRPIDSMTEEEREELFNIWKLGKDGGSDSVPKLLKDMFNKSINENRLLKLCTSFENWIDVMTWLNAHHFDYRGLITKGLAFEAPKEIL